MQICSYFELILLYCLFNAIFFYCSESDEASESENEESENSNASGEEDDDDSSDDENQKAKGVQGLIEIENPNRAQKKAAEKVTKVNVNAPGTSKPDLSRREREELERQRAAANYQKLHAEGKTEQARADLARLAIIKQHRHEAAARREAEKKGTSHKQLSVRLQTFPNFLISYSICRKRRTKQENARKMIG